MWGYADVIIVGPQQNKAGLLLKLSTEICCVVEVLRGSALPHCQITW